MAHAEENHMKKGWVVLAVIIAIILIPIFVKMCMKLGKLFAGIVLVCATAFVANVIIYYKVASAQSVEYVLLAACILIFFIKSSYR